MYYIPIIDLPSCPPIIALFFGVRLNVKSKSVKKAVVATICIIATLWVVSCVGLYRVMRQPPEHFARVMAKIPGPVAFLVLPFETLWMHARTGALQVGSPAPDFALTNLEKTARVQLSSFSSQNRPVVLVFGSYT
jgi:hypothetical protein